MRNPAARRYLDQRLRLRLLRALDAIERQRSLLKASAAVGLSQLALTKGLQKLEDRRRAAGAGLGLHLHPGHVRGARHSP